MRDSKEDKMLAEILLKYGISPELYKQTLQEERKRVHMQRRRNISDELRHIIEQHASKGDVK